MKMKKLFCIALALVMIVGCFAGCGGSGDNGDNNGSGTTTDTPEQNTPVTTTDEPEAGSDTGTFKIGGTGPLTGGAAIYGTAAKNGAQIAVDEINALGGIQFELNYQDDEHDPEKAVNAYNALKDWGVQITLSSVTSAPAAATSAELYADHIFGLTPSASSTDAIKNNDNVFQMCFTDPNQGSASAQYIHDQNLGEKIGVIYNNSDNYSTGIYETFREKANELGLEVVSVQTFTDDSQNDFSVQIADAQNNGADLVFLPIYYTPASLIFQQAAAVGYSPKYFGVDGMDGILTLDGFDTSYAEGVMLLTPFNADAADERTVSFVSKYQRLHGETPNQFAADGYDCVYAIYEAILASDGAITSDMSAQDICDVLIAIFTGDFSFDGLTGEDMTWDESGAVSKQPKGMIIRNGSYVGMD